MWCSSVGATDVEYVDENTFVGNNDVVFVNKDGKKLIRRFKSPFLARKFIIKCEKGKSIKVVWKGAGL